MTDTPLQPSAPADPQAQPAGTAVLEPDRVVEPQEPGDHERFAHYVKKDKIMESALSGDPVIALCGKVWVPGRDPKRFPVCPMCREIYQGLRPEGDGDGGDGKGGGPDQPGAGS